MKSPFILPWIKQLYELQIKAKGRAVSLMPTEDRMMLFNTQPGLFIPFSPVLIFL
jgi:hypothetical protein